MSNFTIPHKIVVPLSEMVIEYCSRVNRTVFVILGLIFLMWLFEPKVLKWSKSLTFKDRTYDYIFGDGNIHYMYKWVGLGLLFLAGYLLWLIK